MRTIEVNTTMVDVIMRKTDANVMYFSYLVALRCNVDRVDLADPVRSNPILTVVAMPYLYMFKMGRFQHYRIVLKYFVSTTFPPFH